MSLGDESPHGHRGFTEVWALAAGVARGFRLGIGLNLGCSARFLQAVSKPLSLPFCFSEQLRRRQTKPPRNPFDVVQRDVCLAPLNRAHIGAMHAASVSEGLLR